MRSLRIALNGAMSCSGTGFEGKHSGSLPDWPRSNQNTPSWGIPDPLAEISNGVATHDPVAWVDRLDKPLVALAGD